EKPTHGRSRAQNRTKTYPSQRDTQRPPRRRVTERESRPRRNNTKRNTGPETPPGPNTDCPTPSTPETALVTVNVFPVIEPVTIEAGVLSEPTKIERTCAHDPSA